jgi:hypothetical protein
LKRLGFLARQPRWSLCLAFGWSFSRWCRDRGLERRFSQ